MLAAALVGLSAFLLKNDVWAFWTWYLLAFLLGLMTMPLTGWLFRGFRDKGWIFSKVLAIALTGFFTWFLVAVELLPFTSVTCVGVVVLVCGAGGLILHRHHEKKGFECIPFDQGRLIFWEEMLFFFFFLLWTYLAGFHPAAYGTEKFMDYGFMEAMMRSEVLPAKDLWYSEGTINYYYGGQYFAVFLTKLSGCKVEITYNLMRTFVAGFAFAMPFSLVYQMAADRLAERLTEKKSLIPSVSGITAGLAVSIAGNMHYVIYSKILPWIQKWKGEEVTGYWFPNATRYIGHNPDVPDKTIHEFPCYSFVLGDLHAHVVNIIFVLLITGILYAWMKNTLSDKREEEVFSGKKFWRKQLFCPHILLAAMLLGMFQWSNFWDFVIYFVVTGGVVLFANIIQFQGKIKTIFAVTAAQAVEVLLVAYGVILPFNLKFDTMFQGIGIAQYHSRFYQLMVLWGLPGIFVLLLIFSVLGEKLKDKDNRGLYKLMKAIEIPDLFAVIMGLCALGLVLIPELVYVRDIYENGNARANTMFKLTYQAYILFGMTMGYGIYRLLAVSKERALKVLSGIGLVCLCWTLGYFGNSVHAWFGNVLNPAEYQGLDATAFLETDFPQDASAIRWLKANVKGSPVVLEANGDSYTGYERVSAMTGLPTVLGWYVHEWLWRNDTGDLNQKSADIQSIYTSVDEELVRELIEKYEISYIVVGSKEFEKYGDSLNEGMLSRLGEKVFQSENSSTYILKTE